MKTVKVNRRFKKQYLKSPAKVQKAFDSRLQLFLSNPSASQLHAHLLIGEYKRYKSINITGDWRALFKEFIDEEGNETIEFQYLGTHSQLYG